MSVGKKSLERVANVAATKDETVSAAEKTSEVKAQAPSPVKKSVKKTAAIKKSDNTAIFLITSLIYLYRYILFHWQTVTA